MVEMMQEELIEKKGFSPYIHWKIFASLVERFHNTAVPSRIDNSVLTSMSGSNRGQLKSALKFLRLTDDIGLATDSLKNLVQSYKTELWQSTLQETISTAYAPIVNGLDITAASLLQLKDRFRKAGGVDGSTIDKSVRFYLAALKEAGVSFSPHFDSKPGRTTGSRRVSKRTVKAKAGTPSEKNHEQEKRHEHPQEHGHRSVPPGTLEFPVNIPGKPQVLVIMPENITEDEWAVVESLCRGYIRLRHKPETSNSN